MHKRSNLMTRILIAVSCAAIAAFACFSVYIGALQRESARAAVRASITASGSQAAQSVANWLNGRMLLTAAIADEMGSAKAGSDALPVLANRVLGSTFLATYFGEEDGKFTISPADDMPKDYDPRKRPWYQQAVAAHAPVVTPPYVDASSGDFVITAAVPVIRDGKLAGVAASDFSLAALSAMVRSINVSEGGFAFVVDKSGKILMHPDASLVTKNLAEVFPTQTPKIGEGLMATVLNGHPTLVSFVPVKGLPSVEWYIGFALDSRGVYAAVDHFRNAAIVATILAVASLIALLALLLSRLVIRPVTAMTGVMERLADGNLDVGIRGSERSDQIGSMARAVEVFRRSAIANRRLQAEADESRARNEAARARIREDAEAGAQARLLEATTGLARGLRRLAAGDLAFQLDDPFAADFEQLRHDLNSAVTQLGATLSAVAQTSGAIDSGSREISHSADDLATRTERQATALEQTASALDEITVNVSNSTARVEAARAVTALANSSAAQSGSVVSDAIIAMQRIETSSSQISNIIGVIDEIAFQTNLLALNAGVEAARAGDAGKGFAVVAQEVRELAQRSAQAAKEIKGLIHNSTTEVETGVRLVRDTGDALKAIGAHIITINEHMDAIAVSAREQTSGLSEVNAAVNKMDQVTQQNVAMVEETNAASGVLAAEAASLRDLLARFRLAGTQAETATRRAA